MAPNTTNPSNKTKAPNGLPGVETLTIAHHRAARKMAAVQRTPLGRRALNVVRNLVWVVPLTILVWLYAEREQFDSQRVTIPITISTERQDRIATIISPMPSNLVVDLKGPRSRIEQARQDLSARQGIQILVPAQTPVGKEVALASQAAIENDPVFLNNGVTVKAPEPQSITVKIDEMHPGLEVRPQVSPDILSRLDAPPTFDPPVVKIVGPRSLVTDAKDPPIVMAEISEQVLPKIGSADIPTVTLTLKHPNELLKIVPLTLKARVRIKSAIASYTLSSVPVFVMGPPALMEKYRVVFPNGPFIPRVTFLGPEDQISRIRNNEIIPKAVLEIRQEDATQHLPRSPSSFILPADASEVKVSDEDKTRTIDFTLVERTRLE